MCNSPFIHPKLYTEYGIRQLIPCGQCLGCREDNLALWQARCNSEYVKYRSAFVTFTYDDLHLPYNENALLPTVRNEELHKYLDNIRHKVKKLSFMPEKTTKDFSFFACSDYGGMFARPHYHVLFFGLDFAEHKKLFVDSWKNGSIKSLPVLQGGVRYVCNYISEKATGEMAEIEYDQTNRERPKMFISRGLGSELFYAHAQEIIETGTIKLGSRTIPCPIYYKKLVDSFSSDSVTRKEEIKISNYKKVMRTARELGFDTYEKYIRYERKASELALATRYRAKGKRCLPQYNKFESILDGHVPDRIKVRLENEYS